MSDYATDGHQGFKPKTTHPLVGGTCIIPPNKYPRFPHSGAKVVAADDRGDSLFTVFAGDPGIYILHRRDIEAP